MVSDDPDQNPDQTALHAGQIHGHITQNLTKNLTIGVVRPVDADPPGRPSSPDDGLALGPLVRSEVGPRGLTNRCECSGHRRPKPRMQIHLDVLDDPVVAVARQTRGDRPRYLIQVATTVRDEPWTC